MQIYEIKNKINNKSYIGSTGSCFTIRYQQGKWWKWTHSTHLKCAVEKYGLENFEVKILWDGICSEEQLSNMEKDYIFRYNSFVPKGYNLTTGGKSTKAPTHVKAYEIIDSKGNNFSILNLSKFCRDNKLSYTAMLNMVSGVHKSSQGYALKGTPISEIKIVINEVELFNIFSNEAFHLKRGVNCDAFKEKYGLKTDSINSLFSKKNYLTKNGWTSKENVKKACEKFKFLNVKLIHSNGEIVDLNKKNTFQLCREKNLHRGSMYRMISGEVDSYKGWTVLNKNS